ncbi:sarcosine oxidase subunit gamma [Methylobacterium marchantiae]|uniref:Sarcosine oxidase subunit gamma n=1 Tax=Methylobacterium marchantiae TaxID=600331 RepID=A0ABW3WSZ4_9HYPH
MVGAEKLESIWKPRSAWAGYARAGRHGRTGGEAGITLTLRDEVGLATLIVADGKEAALDRALEASHGWSLPEAGRAALAGEEGLIWSGPGQWLAIAGTRRRLDGLADAVTGLASVTDQSDGRALVRVSGPCAREMLSKGVAIDLHPRAFRAGSAAVTSIAHIGAQLWQRDDAPTYDLAVARSFAGSFWSWLSHAAAEFGYGVEHGPGR